MFNLCLGGWNRPVAPNPVDGPRLSTGPHDFNDTLAEFR